MKQAIKTLETAIQYHKDCYYNNTPEISDAEYDRLEEELRELDPNNPVLNKVGSPVVHPALSTKHQIWMPSIQKFQKVEDVEKWIGNKSVVYSFKLDGHSMSLIYKSGKFQQALTRGDGEFGEDRTEFFNYIKIPDNIELLQKIDVVIWGEVVITKENFELLQQEMVSLGLEPVKSIRNSASVLNGKSNKQLAKYFDFVAHNIFKTDGEFKLKHSRKFDYLKVDCGFQIPNWNHSFSYKISEYIDLYNTTDKKYLTDGIVITEDHENYDLEDKTSHHYRWNCCWKKLAETAVTKVTDITWNVGRTGKLTPLVTVEPTELSGCTISKITGHNASFIIDKQIIVGDDIEIRRSNEIIPQILNNQSQDSTSSTRQVLVPHACPSCGESLSWSDSGTDLFCTNHEECPAQIISKLTHYASVQGMENISESTVTLFVEHGLVKTFYDFYKITTNDLLRLPKIKEKKAQVIMTSIDQSIRNWSDEKFVVALGIPNIGKDVAKKLIGSGLQYLKELVYYIEESGEYSKTELIESIISNFDGIGEVIANTIYSQIGLIIDSLETIKTQLGGLIVETPKEATKEPIQGLKLSGKRFILSGSFSAVKREIEALIIENGGIIQSTVNKELDFLVTNEVGTSKYNKSVQLGKKIITESELMEMIK